VARGAPATGTTAGRVRARAAAAVRAGYREDFVMLGHTLLAIAAVGGTALGRLGERSKASSAAWAAAGAAVRMLHDAPLPPWPGQSLDELASHLAGECEWPDPAQ
jgi:hypothetical protein